MNFFFPRFTAVLEVSTVVARRPRVIEAVVMDHRGPRQAVNQEVCPQTKQN